MLIGLGILVYPIHNPLGRSVYRAPDGFWALFGGRAAEPLQSSASVAGLAGVPPAMTLSPNTPMRGEERPFLNKAHRYTGKRAAAREAPGDEREPCGPLIRRVEDPPLIRVALVEHAQRRQNHDL